MSVITTSKKYSTEPVSWQKVEEWSSDSFNPSEWEIYKQYRLHLLFFQKMPPSGTLMAIFTPKESDVKKFIFSHCMVTAKTVKTPSSLGYKCELVTARLIFGWDHELPTSNPTVKVTLEEYVPDVCQGDYPAKETRTFALLQTDYHMYLQDRRDEVKTALSSLPRACCEIVQQYIF